MFFFGIGIFGSLVAQKSNPVTERLLEKYNLLIAAEKNQDTLFALTVELEDSLEGKNLYLAIEYSQKALQLAKELNKPRFIIRELTSLGGYHLDIGEYGKSMQYYVDSYSYASEIKDKKFIGGALNNIG
ncbi:MAG TPA: hypothetical protein VNX68_06465, partial [Nitrosopumilaceae archaeon]|nr:hypothetical protein [Nitrosopumilaceae archaeon]